MTGGLYGGVQGFWVRTYIFITTPIPQPLVKAARLRKTKDERGLCFPESKVSERDGTSRGPV